MPTYPSPRPQIACPVHSPVHSPNPTTRHTPHNGAACHMQLLKLPLANSVLFLLQPLTRSDTGNSGGKVTLHAQMPVSNPHPPNAYHHSSGCDIFLCRWRLRQALLGNVGGRRLLLMNCNGDVPGVADATHDLEVLVRQHVPCRQQGVRDPTVSTSPKGRSFVASLIAKLHRACPPKAQESWSHSNNNTAKVTTPW